MKKPLSVTRLLLSALLSFSAAHAVATSEAPEIETAMIVSPEPYSGDVTVR